MIAALENGRKKAEDEPEKLVTDLTLRQTVDVVCREYPEPLLGFGNSGNDAWLTLECFLVCELLIPDLPLVQLAKTSIPSGRCSGNQKI
jgi:hypothetical protein